MYHQRFKTRVERFREKHDVGDGCWNWRGNKERPYFRWDPGRIIPVARAAWQLANGRLLKAGEHVCHTCDNGRCVNPDHLFVGSHTENMRDKANKGRSHRPRGVSNGRAKLTDGAVREIKAKYAAGGVSQQSLADEYGVSQHVISEIILNRIWRHIE